MSIQQMAAGAVVAAVLMAGGVPQAPAGNQAASATAGMSRTVLSDLQLGRDAVLALVLDVAGEVIARVKIF